MSLALALQNAYVLALHGDNDLSLYMGKAKFVHNTLAPPGSTGRYMTLGTVAEDSRRLFARKGSRVPELLHLWSNRADSMDVLTMYDHVERVLDRKPLSVPGHADVVVRTELLETLDDNFGGSHGVVRITARGFTT